MERGERDMGEGDARSPDALGFKGITWKVNYKPAEVAMRRLECRWKRSRDGEYRVRQLPPLTGEV